MFGYVVIKYKNLLNHCNYKDYSRRIVSVLAVAKGIPFATRFFLVNHFIYYHIIIKKSTKRKYFYMQFIP